MLAGSPPNEALQLTGPRAGVPSVLRLEHRTRYLSERRRARQLSAHPLATRTEIKPVQSTYRDLKTDRLVLRRPEKGDAAHIFRAFGSDPEVTRFLTWRPHRSIADAEAALAQRLQCLTDGSEYSWIVQRPDHREAIGIVSAWLAGGSAELGFVLARAHWRLGLMTEAVLAVTEWAFAEGNVTKVWATCDVENLASVRVLEKAGLTNRGIFEREIVRPNLSPIPRPSLLFEAQRPAA